MSKMIAITAGALLISLNVYLYQVSIADQSCMRLHLEQMQCIKIYWNGEHCKQIFIESQIEDCGEK